MGRGRGKIIGGQRGMVRAEGGFSYKRPDAALISQAYETAAISAAAERFMKFLERKRNPEERMVSFFHAVEHGMPPLEAAGFFLDLDPLSYMRQYEENDVFRNMVNTIHGDVALRQYSKVVNADNYKSAIEWLKVNRHEWRDSGRMPVESILRGLPDETVFRMLSVADLAEHARPAPKRGRRAKREEEPEG